MNIRTVEHKLKKYKYKYSVSKNPIYKQKIQHYQKLLQNGGVIPDVYVGVIPDDDPSKPMKKPALPQGYHSAEDKILGYNVKTLRDLIERATTSKKDREIVNNSITTYKILRKLCPNKTVTQDDYGENYYYDCLLECLKDYLDLKQSLGQFAPTNWPKFIDTPIEELQPFTTLKYRLIMTTKL
jgi:hypothetical protein